MKKIWLSLVVILVGLLVWAYAAPVSPFVVSSGNIFPDDKNHWFCSVFDELFFLYPDFDVDAKGLKPLAHICLGIQLLNIRSMDDQTLQEDIAYWSEVYHLDLDNLNRAAYREKHIDSFEDKTFENNDGMYVPHLSLSFTEEEIFNLLLGSVEQSRRMMLSEYPNEYEACKAIITEETVVDNFSDEQWACIKLSYKAHAKYANKYSSADEYSLDLE